MTFWALIAWQGTWHLDGVQTHREWDKDGVLLAMSDTRTHTHALDTTIYIEKSLCV